MLARRRRRRANIKPALVQSLAPAETARGQLHVSNTRRSLILGQNEPMSRQRHVFLATGK